MTRRLLLFLLGITLLLPTALHAGTVQLPQTGQTSCWGEDGPDPGTEPDVIACPGTGQDGELRAGVPWPNPRFTVQGDCVTDNLTGLMWPRNGNLAGALTRQGALDFAASLYLCGHTDWRLPNLNELESLVNAQQAISATWLNGQDFTGFQSNYYWSSSTYASNSNYVWFVNMYDGGVSATYKGNYCYVLPVRAGQ